MLRRAASARSRLRPFRARIALAGLALGLLLVPVGIASNGTHVSGTISANATWSAAGSPYIVDGNVSVAAGVTLTIDPGVVVKFNGQFRTMFVNGTLKAVGTEAQPIVFTSIQDDSVGGDSNGDGAATSPAPGQWYMIQVKAGTASEFRYVTVRYGGYGSANWGYGAIEVSGVGTSAVIDRATITNNQRSGLKIFEGGATVTASTISNNGNGISTSQGWVAVDNRTFVINNTQDGLWFNLTSTYAGPGSTIMDSDLAGNGRYGAYIQTSTDALPASKYPRGNRNNIYANSGGRQINPTTRRRDVDWTGNFWGVDVYHWTNPAACLSEDYQARGRLATRPVSQPPAAGPITSSSYLAGSPAVACYYDRLKIGPDEFSPYYLGGTPVVPIPQTFGGLGETGYSKPISVLREDPVNAATGSFTHQTTDLSLPGTGVALEFTRSYNSLDSTVGPLGQGWQHNHAAALTVNANGDVSARMGDGQEFEYLRQQDGSFTTPAGSLSTLTSVTGGYELTRNDQVKYAFDSEGRLTSLKDRNNQGLTYAYDVSGRLQTITDATGRQATLAYDTSNNLTSVTTADGRSVSYGYTSGRLTSVTDAAGKVWTYAYESRGLLEKEIDPLANTIFRNLYGDDGRVIEQYDALNNKTTFTWDYQTQTSTITDPRNNVWRDVFAGNVPLKEIAPLGNETVLGHGPQLDQTSATSPSGETTSMTYDARGNLTQAVAPASLQNATKTLSYDADNNLTTVVDARGKVTSYGYDAEGNNTSVTQDGQTVATSTYDAAGRVLTSTDGRGNSTGYTYDTNGNLASVTDPLGNQTTYTYDSAGRMTTRVDPLGNVTGANPLDYTWTWTYDAAGRTLTESDPLGNTTTYTYDDAGNKLTETDARNKTSMYAYNAANQLVSVTAPDGGVTTYTYDAAGNRLTQTDPRNKSTTYTYDANNRLKSMTTPLGNQTTYFYDQDGNQVKVVEPRGNLPGANPDDYATTSTYDAAGRLLTETDALGATTTYGYDLVGNRTLVTNAKGRETNYSYDAAGRLLSITTPDAGITSYTYDVNGNLLTRANANSRVTTYTYDAANRLTAEVAPDADGPGPQGAPTATFSYDENGNLTSKTDPNGNATVTVGDGITSRGYDRANRLTSINYSDATPDVVYTYDAVGNRASMVDGEGTVTYGYDDVNRLVAEQRSSAGFSYSYDLNGNVTTRVYPNGATTTYTYDDDNRLLSATRDAKTTSFSYDVSGRLTQMALPSTNGYVESRGYDRVGRLTQLTNSSSSNTLSAYTTVYDEVGNPTTVTRTGSAPSITTYSYDVRDRLVDVCFQTMCASAADPFVRWTYDKVGNRLTEDRPGATTSYAYNALDQITQSGPVAYSYDANGNQLSAGADSFAYDVDNRLIASTIAGVSTQYSYDGDGERTGAVTSGSTRRYSWDHNALGGLSQLAIEEDGAGGVLRTYTYGIRRVGMQASGGTHYYHYDPLGSVSDVTSSSGASDWTYSYEPFGAERSAVRQPGAPENPMRFGGELLDPSGLYYLRARQYDPTAGRFLQVDPATPSPEQPILATYIYAADRPTVLIDPSGRTAIPSNVGPGYAADATSRTGSAYSYIFDIGFYGTPKGLSAFTRSHCRGLFPIKGCVDDFRTGTILKLQGGPGSKIGFPVRVTSIQRTSFSFVALPGHPEGEGRRITFGFSQSGIRQRLNVSTSENGSAATRWWGVRQLNFWLAKQTWAKFAENIRATVAWNANDGGRPIDA